MSAALSAHWATFATIFFSMILVNNYVLVQFLGICPFLGVSKKADSSVGMGLAVIFVMVLATAVTFPIQIFLLDQYDMMYMQTIIFILVIAVLVQLIEIILKRYIPALYRSLGVYLPLITTNCCVLGVTILAVQDYSADVATFGFGIAFAEALICAAGAGVGFLVAMLLFCGVRQRVECANPPESFKGLPITLVAAAITSMSFMGFGGLVENIISAIS
ncbi:MAG: RnfABCDGE type electron transport complex subunit A [Pygmaiobacter sp.]|nr:RnfABCDGE type electron transport complex subunit A [Pygmaiobacter sp.]